MKKTIGLLTIAASIFTFANIDKVFAYSIESSEIPNSTYVIGNHMLTREGSDKYNGTLTTNVIMLASKTIESDELDDMIIYYKNARGVWVDALTGNTIQISDSVDIQYKNLDVFIVTPTLSTTDSPDGSKYVGYENGEYIYDFAIEVTKYVSDVDNNVYTIDGYEVYEKNGTEYKSVKTGLPAGAASVGVEVGTKKTFVARAYALNKSGDKVYSDYSNEVVIDHSKIEAPQLSTTDSPDGSKYVGYENGEYIYDFAIEVTKYVSDVDNNVYTIDGYEVYEKNGTEYKSVKTGLPAGAASVGVEVGTKKTFVARAYALNKSGDKVYSDYSNEVVIDHSKIEAPQLSTTDSPDGSKYVGYENGEYIYDFAIEVTKYVSDVDNNVYTIDGYEVYEKNGTEYKSVKTGLPAGAASVGVEVGTKKTFVARAYALNKSGDKVYSDYSNEVVIDHSKIEAPVLGASGGLNENGEDVSSFGLDYLASSDGYGDLIDGWLLYEKNGDKYTEVTYGTIATTENGHKEHTVTINKGEKKTFVAKAYALNKSGEKVYSDYSNEYEVDNSNQRYD